MISYHPSIIIVCYCNRYGKLGSLFWIAASMVGTGAPTELASNQLQLHAVTDMQQLKATAALQTAAANGVIPDHCMSLISPKANWSLEALSGQQQQLWWRGIYRVVSSTRRPLLGLVHQTMKKEDTYVMAMEKGAILTTYIQTRAGVIKTEHVHVWYRRVNTGIQPILLLLSIQLLT
jgi:hypothetical protein